jgi:RNA polymerase sigma-70 factor (ECF subfamily)
MAADSLKSVQLQLWFERMQAGDGSARDELLRVTQDRLEQLARRMLRKFPNVRRWADSGDVFQGAVMRLLRSLEAVRPVSVRDFFNLAAVHIRRELLDLARHYGGPLGIGANHASVGPGDSGGPAAPEAQDRSPDVAELERWAALHVAVEGLPTEEREVFGLTFYHGWTQAQIAELFAVDERTVRRRWKAACLTLHHTLGGELPAV